MDFTNKKQYSSPIRVQLSHTAIDRSVLQNGALSLTIFFNFHHKEWPCCLFDMPFLKIAIYTCAFTVAVMTAISPGLLPDMQPHILNDCGNLLVSLERHQTKPPA